MENKKRGRPAKVKIVEPTGVNNSFLTQQEVKPEPVIVGADELVPKEGESEDYKKLRELYIAYRRSNLDKWNKEKVVLLDKLYKK